MDAMRRLKLQAKDSAEFRGHTLSKFLTVDVHSAIAECLNCQKMVAVDTNPPPNGIEAMGDVVALGGVA